MAAAAALAVITAPAQINSPLPDGYLTRARAMYADGNFIGCMQQLDNAPACADTDFLRAMAAYRQADPDALTLLRQFINANPSSPLLPEAVLAAADICFDREQWTDALSLLVTIDDTMLDDSLAEKYRYHKAYAMLRTGSDDAALSLFSTLTGTRRYGNAARFYTAYIAYAKGDYATALDLFRKVKPTDEAPADMTDYYLSQLYYNNRDWSKALSTARRLLDRKGIEPAYTAEAARVAGESAFGCGDNSAAVSYLRRYRQMTGSPLPSALYVLGISEYESGDYEAAARSFEPVAALDNAMGQSAALYLGQSLMQTGNYTPALLALERACRIGYDRQIEEAALYNYAVAKMQGGKVPFGSSVASFEQFLNRFPDSRFAPEVQHYIINGYLTDNNYEAALNSINSIKNPTRATLDARQQVLYTLGTRYLATGELNRAMNALREAKAMGNRIPAIATECDLWMGEILYKQGKFSQAAACYRDYLKHAASDAPNRQIARYDLGYALFGEKKFADAAQEFGKFTKAPGSAGSLMLADAFNRLGDCKYYDSDFSAAVELYDKAFDTDPAVGDYALYQKAVMKGLRRDHQGKVDGMKQLMKSFPQSGLYPSALLELAEAYIEMEKYELAMDAYTLLAEKFPSTAQGRQGRLLLAITRLSQGNRDGAIATYKEVITLYPTSDEARVASEDLKKIYLDSDRLAEYMAFMRSVPDAPAIDPSELEEMSFAAAERAFNADGSTRRVEKYLRDYPAGNHLPQANLMMAKGMAKEGQHRKTIAYTMVIVDKYPHSAVTDEALLLKAQAEIALGMERAALDTYRRLESVASSAASLNVARLGIIRASRDIDEPESVLAAADALLASTTVGTGEREEVSLARANALSQLDRTDEARQEWQQLAMNPQSIFGTKAAFALASDYFAAGDLKDARQTVEALIDANPPHNYWMARAFILLSDINRAEGNTFEADEYLRSLRQNYPGTESDIFTMIDQRLQ